MEAYSQENTCVGSGLNEQKAEQCRGNEEENIVLGEDYEIKVLISCKNSISNKHMEP